MATTGSPENTTTITISGPDIAACEFGLAGCLGHGALIALTNSPHGGANRCCQRCGGQLLALDGVLVLPVVS